MRTTTGMLVGLMGLMACGGGDDPATDGLGTEDSATTPAVEAPDYAAWGPHSVGTAEGEIDGPEGLTFTAQFWFPSDDDQGVPVNYDGLLAGEATEGLAPACDTPRPVMVFSHGLGGVRWQSPFFVEHLASHGFLVVAVDHIGSGLFDTNASQIGAVAVRRPADVAAAFEGAAAAYPDCVDTNAGYAVSGHSFGGYTALAAGGAEVNDPTNGGAPVDLGDDRVWAVIGLAPWDGFGAITNGTADIEVPTLILTGREDQTTPLRQVRGLWDPLTVSPRVFGIFDNAGHYSFSPAACILENGDGCGPGFLSEDEFNPLVNQVSMAFLAREMGVIDAEAQVGVDADVIEWDVVD